LSGTKLDDHGAEHLGALRSLQRLRLESTLVSDAGLKHLNTLRSVQWLFLCNTQVSDAGLEHLKGMPSLIFLNLQGTMVTDAGVEDFKKAMPKVVVVDSSGDSSGPGGPGRLPAGGSHRPERAQLTHSVPQVTRSLCRDLANAVANPVWAIRQRYGDTP
jgi:hypothetical protein